MACLLFHFRIFCSMSCAEEITQMDHKPTILVIKESLYLYVALFNVCGIPQTYHFLLWTGWPNRKLCIPTSSFNLLLIQSALLFTTAFLLIFLFWTVTTKKFHIGTFSLTGQCETHRHSGLPFFGVPVEYAS